MEFRTENKITGSRETICELVNLQIRALNVSSTSHCLMISLCILFNILQSAFNLILSYMYIYKHIKCLKASRKFINVTLNVVL